MKCGYILLHDVYVVGYLVNIAFDRPSVCSYQDCNNFLTAKGRAQAIKHTRHMSYYPRAEVLINLFNALQMDALQFNFRTPFQNTQTQHRADACQDPSICLLSFQVWLIGIVKVIYLFHMKVLRICPHASLGVQSISHRYNITLVAISITPPKTHSTFGLHWRRRIHGINNTKSLLNCLTML